jgi:FkbM family methyltransferase
MEENGMTKMLPVKINGRWDILLPEHRAARPEWTSAAGWERPRLDAIYKWITTIKKQNPVVYYVGAEEGDMNGLLDMWGARQYMFEPNPKVWANIKGIWDANKLSKRFTAIAGFAGNESSQPFNIHAGHFPEAANGEMIAEHGFMNLCEANGEVPIYKIDDMVEQGANIPDMISIDVEGAEWEVLKGAEQTLRAHRPTIFLSLHPEFMYEIYGVYGNDLRQWLKNMGYKETLLDYQHEVHLMYEATNE